jgi:Cd2+/Zn2+-exporting ATPase
MDCSEEITILERRLKPLAGLEAVSTDLIGKRLYVQYDAARLSTATMVDAVGNTGMRIWLEHDAPVSSGGLEWRWRLVLTSAGCVAVGAVLALTGRPDWARWCFLAATALGGAYPARRALVSLRTRSIDINVLMVAAVAGAIALGDWFEAAAVVLLFAVAQWLEARTLDRARQAIRALMDLSPAEALVRRDGRDVSVAVDGVAIGEEIIIRPGDTVPLDGVVSAGQSDVNEAPLTGESLPVDKAPGVEVYAGTVNGGGALDVTVTRLRRDTRLARIIHLVETAQAQRAPTQAFVERFARVYTPIVMVGAIAVAVLPWLAGGDVEVWTYRALVLLVTACPCALVISTPVSVVAALAGAAKRGVLIKGGVHLERLAAVRVVAFDKTGTLTRGEPRVVGVHPVGPMTAEQVVRLAAAVELRAVHPIGVAVTRHGAELYGEITPAAGVAVLPGLGAEGTVEGRHVVVGNARLFRDRGLSVREDDLAALKTHGGTLIFVAADGQAVGVIAVADSPRDTARETVRLLRDQIDQVVMLSGDQPETAGPVARELGIDEWHAGLLPDEKHAMIAGLRQTHGPVMMVGDGINDAPALAAADVGVAMGTTASDAALETADVALLSNELLRLPYVVRLARATLRNIHGNITISLALKVAFLVMAVTGSATLWMAILADTGASVIVVVNALRLLRAE